MHATRYVYDPENLIVIKTPVRPVRCTIVCPVPDCGEESKSTGVGMTVGWTSYTDHKCKNDHLIQVKGASYPHVAYVDIED